MQEEIDNKTIALAVNTTKLTGRVLAKAMIRILNKSKNTKSSKITEKVTTGKQSIKDLAKQNQGMTSLEVTDGNIKEFDKYAKKFGVDYAVKKDSSVSPPKYIVFFKARDQDAIFSAFKDFSADKMNKATRPSAIQKLKNVAEKAKDKILEKVKIKTKEQAR